MTLGSKRVAAIERKTKILFSNESSSVRLVSFNPDTSYVGCEHKTVYFFGLVFL
jgi:hypothetical protein